jgi:WS/DGAT/MGAT family acyltransferase
MPRRRSLPTVERVQSHLTPIESIMWELGQDPTMRMTLGVLIVLDHAPPDASVVERLASAAAHEPRLTVRPCDRGRLTPRLVWAPELDFDPANHVRQTSIAQPGDERQLLDLLAILEIAPFDPHRSPWDVTLISGLEGGRAAMYLRCHHVVADGRGGVSLIDLVLDDPVRPRPPRAEDGDAPDAIDNADRARAPGTVTLTVDLTGVARTAASGVVAAASVRPVDAIARGAQRTLELASSIARQVVVTGDRLSPLPSIGGMSSYFDVLSVPGAREAALALGGGRNDMLVASAAAGLGDYHRRLGLSCRELRLAMPASRRRDGAVRGNWFAPTRVAMPASARPPGPQFGIVAERLSRTRREPALHAAAALASLISHVPARALIPSLIAQARTVDFAATALPGLRRVHHVCGAAVEEAFPFGPRLGCLVNLTGFANDDRLDVGIAVDPVAIADPELLVGCLTEAFEQFVPKVRRASPDVAR